MASQVEYKCWNSQGEWAKLPDIDFRVKGEDGINLTDAMDERFDGPDGRDDLMFTDESVKGSVACRIIVRTFRSDSFRACSSVRLVQRISGAR